MTQLDRFTFSASAFPVDIGIRLKKLRKQLGWTQSDLAKCSGIAMGTISRTESYRQADGRCIGGRRPRAETVLRLLAAMFDAGADFELSEIVPDWPEAIPGRPFGYGPLSHLRRRELGLSLEEVANEAGIDNSTLSRFERNATPHSTLYRFERTKLGDVMPELHSLELAKALRFESVKEHRDWCIARERGKQR